MGLVHKTKNIPMEIDVLEENRKLADKNHQMLRERGIRSIDVMGSIGSGKTSLIVQMCERVKAKGRRVAAIAGDVSGEDDYMKFRSSDIPSTSLNTGKECHLDAHLVEHSLEHLDLEKTDLLFIENVGNLVCPADFPLGTDFRMVVISVTEGEDMIRKHPMIFSGADIVVLNKSDLLPHMDIEVEQLQKDLDKVKRGMRLRLTSAKTGEGVDELLEALNL